MTSLDKRITALEARLVPTDCNCLAYRNVVFGQDSDPEPTSCPVHGKASRFIRVIFVPPKDP
jgi:hypothetical protein